MKTNLIKFFLMAMAFLLSTIANAATYTVTSGNYTTKTDFTPACSLGTCTSFDLTMKVSGTFDAPTLAANLSNSNIAASLTSFSFSDGITTYSSTDPTVRIFIFSVTTNASGTLTSATILLEKWLSGTSPHAVNDLFSYLSIAGASNTQAFNNTKCGIVSISLAGIADSCNSDIGGTQRSTATSNSTISYTLLPPPVVAPVPTLSEWSIIILVGLIALFGIGQVRRNPSA